MIIVKKNPFLDHLVPLTAWCKFSISKCVHCICIGSGEYPKFDSSRSGTNVHANTHTTALPPFQLMNVSRNGVSRQCVCCVCYDKLVAYLCRLAYVIADLLIGEN